MKCSECQNELTLASFKIVEGKTIATLILGWLLNRQVIRESTDLNTYYVRDQSLLPKIEELKTQGLLS
jgi:hypothetical protein